jgi:aspartyl-tRNA(Asn)/glutamyl-tRNA(Gln) amidotransferase subunit B
MTVEYEPVIGLEVHAQLRTRTKIFCGCPAVFGSAPNTHVCPVCLGLPGALPVPNREAVSLAVRAGLALGCTIRRSSRFARKNYFYPDLPKGYQISQFDEPICEHGTLDVPQPDGSLRRVGILRAHMEEDAGKNTHGAGSTAHASLVDLNRAGVPLLEIVGMPDIRSAAEAAEYLRQLRAVLMFAGVNDGNLEAGSFRCDANVSVRPRGATAFGTRVEIKNINSFRFVQKALEWEIAAQVATVSAGGRVEQVTKTWDDVAGRCNLLRKKEGSDDYRYFPEPDLPPLTLSEAFVDEARAALPALPQARRRRYVEELGLSDGDARVLTEHPALAEYFESLAARSSDAKRAANWVCNALKAEVHTDGLDARFPVTVAQLAGLFARIDDGTISGKIAKDVYQAMAGTARSADAIIEEKGLRVVTDPAAIEATLRAVLAANAKQLEAYRAGKKAVAGFFKGAAMKATNGMADPRVLDAVLTRLLDGDA